MTEWQQIGEVPVDSGRLTLVDPVCADDVARHEDDRYGTEPEGNRPT